MTTHATLFNQYWRTLLLVAVIPALTNCSRIDGSVELNDDSGEPYSLEGASVEAFELNPTIVLGGQRIPVGLGNVQGGNGAIALDVVTASVGDDALYDVEIRCPASNSVDTCTVESPLHIVLNGTQLKAGGWTATVLTEIAFQNIAYYVATAYSIDETQRMLDYNANALLLALPAGTARDYDDLLAWKAANVEAVKRVAQINAISEALAAGISVGDLKLLAQQAISANLSALDLTPYLPLWNGSIERVTIADGYAFVTGTDFPLNIVDIRDPLAITHAARIDEDFGWTSAVTGDLLYTVVGNEWIDESIVHIYDISNRQQPQKRGALSLAQNVSKIAAAGPRVYAVTPNTLNVIDARNPAAPTLAATLSRPVSALTANGDYVLAGNIYGMVIIDASNPARPLVVGRLATPDTVTHITVIDNYAYLSVAGARASDPVTLHVVDISDPATPTTMTQLTLAPGTGSLMQIGTRAYADTAEVVQILDISNAQAPVLVDTFPQQFAAGTRVSDSGFLTFSYRTVTITDPGIAAQPVMQSGTFAIEDRSTSLITSSGRYAYLPNRSNDVDWGFKVFDFMNPLAPELLTTFIDGRYLGSIAVSGNHAFLGDLEFGTVQVADISNPAEPVLVNNGLWLDEGPLKEELFGVKKLVLSGNRLFVPWGHSANYDDGTGIGRGEWGCVNTDPAAGSYGGVGGLFAIDVSTPAEPTITSHICMSEKADAVAISGNYAFVAVSGGLLQAVDFSNAAQPALAGSLTLRASANAVAVVGGYLWASEGANGLEIIDISNPVAPALSTHIPLPGNVAAINVDGNHAYVATGIGGVHIFDISTPATPQLVGNVSTDLAALTTFIAGDYLYAVTGAGLEIFRAFPDRL